MRFLYGDSVPFPHRFNVLTTLDMFVTAGAKVVELELEARRMTAAHDQLAAERAHSLGELDDFHKAITRAIREAASRSKEPRTAEYTEQLIEHARHLVDAARLNVQETNEREHASLTTEVERRRGEIHAALESFFIAGRLPILEASVRGILDGSNHNVQATLQFPQGIVCEYELATATDPLFRKPLRVGDVQAGTNLMVGLRRGLFRRTTNPELLALDDWVLGRFNMAPTFAQLHLRRKADAEDALAFELRRAGDGIEASVSHLLEEGVEREPRSIDPGDRVHLDRLWQKLADALDALTERRRRVLRLCIDGEDVFEDDLAVFVLERLVAYLGPFVAEVARRSPNPAELSIKVEHENGRREETYLRRKDLVLRFLHLGPTERSVFAGLGLEEPTRAASDPASPAEEST